MKKLIVKEKMSTELKQFFFEEMTRFKVIFIDEKTKSSAGYNLPFYGDFRRLISSPKLLKGVGEEMGTIANRLGADVLASASMSGDAWTASASIGSGIPCVLLRKELPHHGEQSIILGEKPSKKNKIILIEDGIGSAGQAKKFILNMQNEGYQIKTILAIFDCMEGNGEKEKLEFLKEEKVTLHYLFRLQEYFDFLSDRSLISKEFKEIIFDWLNDPASWGEGSKKWDWYGEEKKNGNIWIKYNL